MNDLIFKFIRMSGLFFLIKKFVSKRKVSIVLYHDPKPEVFRKHIEFLNDNYVFISLDLLVTAIVEKKWELIPDNSLVVTFDDGHIGNYNLLPTIREYDIKPTIYCCSDIITTNRHFWWKEVLTSDVQGFKEMNNQDRLHVLKEKFDFFNSREYLDRQALNLDELQAMSLHLSIGSHTRFHPILTCCSKEEAEAEVLGSKLQLESKIGHVCGHFCYPNGDYDESVVESVKSSGYRSGRTIDVGWNDVNTDPYKLKITGITDDASINQVISQLTGITMYLRYMTKGSFKGLYKTLRPKN
jgi:peptidoglycan/xylan/chitin deacetylase (PgdA/CDA1 family)